MHPDLTHTFTEPSADLESLITDALEAKAAREIAEAAEHAAFTALEVAIRQFHRVGKRDTVVTYVVMRGTIYEISVPGPIIRTLSNVVILPSACRR